MQSKIEWTDETWNPVTGCSKISPGCLNCYAERMAKRLRGRFGYHQSDPFKVTYHPSRINQPLRWTKARKIFVCSMGDLFHEDVPDSIIDAVFERVLYGGISHHTFQILTKRPERMAEYCNRPYIATFICDASNVWLGVTAEDQEQANKRIPALCRVPAVVRFVSVEPMLGPVDFDKIPPFDVPGNEAAGTIYHEEAPWDEYINWVIVGGETGPGAREMKTEWVEDLKKQCEQTEYPPKFFMKQMSGINRNYREPVPDHIMVRQFPGTVINEVTP